MAVYIAKHNHQSNAYEPQQSDLNPYVAVWHVASNVNRFHYRQKNHFIIYHLPVNYK